jgi:GTPase SAR1 family protein
MGNENSKSNQQILLVGNEKAGKTLFLKKLMDMKKSDTENVVIDPTTAFNYINLSFNNISYDIWELGGDTISRLYWPTFYRNLKFDAVIFIINLSDKSSYTTAMKELLILVNQEELKDANLYVIFNIILNEDDKKKNWENELKDKSEIANNLMSDLRACSVHSFDTRIFWFIFDITKMKEGETKTTEMLNKILNLASEEPDE